AETGESLEGGLVRRAGGDLGAGGEELPVRGDDRVRVVTEQARGPEGGGEVVTAGLEQRGEPSVEDHRCRREGGRVRPGRPDARGPGPPRGRRGGRRDDGELARTPARPRSRPSARRSPGGSLRWRRGPPGCVW